MINDDKVFFNPGDIVQIRQPLPNRPIMMVTEKVTRNYKNERDGEMTSAFIGIRCRWFSDDQKLQEAIFSTKDLEHIK